MVEAIAVYVKGVGRLPIDSEIKVILREKARFTEALGWSYRFRSGEEWLLVPLEDASVFVYDDRPEASNSRSSSERRTTPRPKLPSEINYADEL